MTGFSEALIQAGGLIVDADRQLWSVVARSLWVSGLACLVAACLGVPLGAWLACLRWRGQALLLAVLNTSLAVPSVVVGLLVYLMLSRSGPLGHLGWLFSFKAMVLAQTLLILPVVVALARQVVADADARHGEQLQSLGASSLQRALALALHERGAMLTVVIAAFGRAIAEVGAVMVVGGNIDGFTRVMTTAIALETSKGDMPLALALGFVLLAVVLLLHASIGLLNHGAERTRQGRQVQHTAATGGVTP